MQKIGEKKINYFFFFGILEHCLQNLFRDIIVGNSNLHFYFRFLILLRRVIRICGFRFLFWYLLYQSEHLFLCLRNIYSMILIVLSSINLMMNQAIGHIFEILTIYYTFILYLSLSRTLSIEYNALHLWIYNVQATKTALITG